MKSKCIFFVLIMLCMAQHNIFAQRFALDLFAGKSFTSQKTSPGLNSLNTFGGRIRFIPDSSLPLALTYQFGTSFYQIYNVQFDEQMTDMERRYSEIGIRSSISRHLLGVCFTNELRKPGKAIYPCFSVMVGQASLRTYIYLDRITEQADNAMFGIESGTVENRVNSNELYKRGVMLYSFGTGLRVYPVRFWSDPEYSHKFLSGFSLVCSAAYTGSWDLVRYDNTEGNYSAGATPSDGSYEVISGQYRDSQKSLGKINLLELNVGVGFSF
ncbi:MAG: hypothetical protein MUC87_14650 [Bacteroidia bacterium]|jgi:hypothetical protein|nr:hypothetical protein [Bacteroidia bacterium]